MTTPSMRKLWFEHVSKTRRKMQRTNKGATHRDAMKEASVTWPKEKVKIQNKHKRESRRLEKENKINVAARATATHKISGPPAPEK
mgnify:FL=1